MKIITILIFPLSEQSYVGTISFYILYLTLHFTICRQQCMVGAFTSMFAAHMNYICVWAHASTEHVYTLVDSHDV